MAIFSAQSRDTIVNNQTATCAVDLAASRTLEAWSRTAKGKSIATVIGNTQPAMTDSL
jgi:hypothetical protein